MGAVGKTNGDPIKGFNKYPLALFETCCEQHNWSGRREWEVLGSMLFRIGSPGDFETCVLVDLEWQGSIAGKIFLSLK
jgi:hypothetical protein